MQKNLPRYLVLTYANNVVYEKRKGFSAGFASFRELITIFFYKTTRKK